MFCVWPLKIEKPMKKRQEKLSAIIIDGLDGYYRSVISDMFLAIFWHAITRALGETNHKYLVINKPEVEDHELFIYIECIAGILMAEGL